MVKSSPLLVAVTDQSELSLFAKHLPPSASAMLACIGRRAYDDCRTKSDVPSAFINLFKNALRQLPDTQVLEL